MIMKFEISPLLCVFIAGLAADPLISVWRFTIILICVIASYALGFYHGETNRE